MAKYVEKLTNFVASILLNIKKYIIEILCDMEEKISNEKRVLFESILYFYYFPN